MTLTLKLDLPPDVERRLRSDGTDLQAKVTEAFLVSLYRQDKLSHVGLSRALNLDRFETEALLRRHEVTQDRGSLEDHLADVTTFHELQTTAP